MHFTQLPQFAAADWTVPAGAPGNAERAKNVETGLAGSQSSLDAFGALYASNLSQVHSPIFY
jgi:hypothetical protein